MPQSLEHSGTSWKGQNLKHDDSLIDLVDERARVLGASVYAVLVVFSDSFLALFAALAISFVTVIVAKLNVRRTLRRMIAMDLFMIFLILTLPFTTPAKSPSDVLFSLGALEASRSGLLHAIQITLKANAVVLMILALVGTMSATSLGHAMARLNVPDKLVHLLLFTVRYLEVIGQEYKRMRNAMRARAFVPKANVHTWRSVGYLVGMLLIHSVERAERIVNAMKCRGYQGKFYLLDESEYTQADSFFVVFLLTASAIVVSLNIGVVV